MALRESLQHPLTPDRGHRLHLSQGAMLFPDYIRPAIKPELRQKFIECQRAHLHQ